MNTRNQSVFTEEPNQFAAVDAVNRYINEVLHNIHASPTERERIQADLRTHLSEAIQSGKPIHQVLDRMGDPKDVAAAFMAQVPIQYAPNGRRMAAFTIDMLFLIILAGLAAIAGAGLGNLTPRHPVTGLDYFIGALCIGAAIAFTLTAVGVIILYFPLQEGRFERTIGKRLLGLRVMKENGLPVGYKESFLRRLPFYFEFWLVDGLFIFFTPKHQRGFDIVARTIVVMDK
ncbi:MAG: RDD family protein [Omnitrophica WOR_2 bacterium]